MPGGAVHFKLGILALVSLAALVTTVFVLGLERAHVPTVSYHTYFDESVQGLDIGSPVKFRGVRSGNVSGITIAPDGQRVDVTLAIYQHHVRRLEESRAAPGFRARLGTQGITGVKLVDLDFFPNAELPELPFTPGPRYIPAYPSLFKGLEDSAGAISRRMPALLDRTTSAMERFDDILAEVDRADIPGRVAEAVESATSVTRAARSLVARIDRANIPGRTRGTLDKVDEAIAKVDAVVDQLGGEHGLVASTRRTVDTFHDLGARTLDSSDSIEAAIRDIRDAAQALRDLLDEIERDPDMLLKGRARSNRP